MRKQMTAEECQTARELRQRHPDAGENWIAWAVGQVLDRKRKAEEDARRVRVDPRQVALL